MHKIKFLVFNIKKSFIPICICVFTMFLLIFSNANLSSAKTGLSLWANSVVPSLLPFFIATELLGYTNVISILGKLLNKFMRPIFNVPGEGSFPFIMGVISGYPMGAKIVSNFKSRGICTAEEAERLLAFTNNSGPLFIIGTVGVGLFKDTTTGVLLFTTHILACLTVGFLFRFWKSSKRLGQKGISPLFGQTSVSISNLGEVLASSIMSAINTIFLIGGFIVLFSVIISILENSGILDGLAHLIHPILNIFKVPASYADGIFTGILELTNGVCNIANIANKSISTNIIICAFLLGFGGVSIMLQILSITSKAKIYTYVFIYTIPVFNLNL